MKLSAKITGVFAVFLLIPLLVFMTLYYARIYTIIRDGYVGLKNTEVNLKAEQIEGLVLSMKEEIVILSRLASINELVNSREGTIDEYKDRVAQDFTSFALQHDWYYQIRYIDETGQEIVRVDKVNGGITRVPEELLQNKSDRYYFQQSMQSLPGRIYISPIDLNVENGIIENRGTSEEPMFVPVIRFAVPISSDTGERKGIVITNIYAQHLLDVLEVPDNQTEYYLVNSDGYFLLHPDRTKTFGFMFPEKNHTLEDEFPEISSLLSQSQTRFTQMENNHLIYVQQFNPFQDPNEPLSITNARNDWIVLKKTNTQEFRDQVWDIVLRLIVYTFGITFFAIIAGYLFIRKNLLPIRKLEEATSIVSQGNLDHTVQIQTGDEIEALATNFNKMVEEMKKTRNQIEEKIQERTERLTKLNKILIGRERKMMELKKRIKELETKHE